MSQSLGRCFHREITENRMAWAPLPSSRAERRCSWWWLQLKRSAGDSDGRGQRSSSFRSASSTMIFRILLLRSSSSLLKSAMDVGQSRRWMANGRMDQLEAQRRADDHGSFLMTYFKTPRINRCLKHFATAAPAQKFCKMLAGRSKLDYDLGDEGTASGVVVCPNRSGTGKIGDAALSTSTH